MTHTNRSRCEHPGCKCEVPVGERFCSDGCRVAAEDSRVPQPVQAPCPCGHPACHDSA